MNRWVQAKAALRLHGPDPYTVFRFKITYYELPEPGFEGFQTNVIASQLSYKYVFRQSET